MNKVILSGRLTKDPEVRYSQGEKPVCFARYTLAVDSSRKGSDGKYLTDFIQCVAIGRNGEFAEKYLKKGTSIMLEGKWQTGSYTNREGVKVYTNECCADHQEFAGPKQEAPAEAPVQTPEPIADPEPDEGFMSIPEGFDEEMPFI